MRTRVRRTTRRLNNNARSALPTWAAGVVRRHQAHRHRAQRRRARL